MEPSIKEGEQSKGEDVNNEDKQPSGCGDDAPRYQQASTEPAGSWTITLQITDHHENSCKSEVLTPESQRC